MPVDKNNNTHNVKNKHKRMVGLATRGMPVRGYARLAPAIVVSLYPCANLPPSNCTRHREYPTHVDTLLGPSNRVDARQPRHQD